VLRPARGVQRGVPPYGLPAQYAVQPRETRAPRGARAPGGLQGLRPVLVLLSPQALAYPAVAVPRPPLAAKLPALPQVMYLKVVFGSSYRSSHQARGKVPCFN